MNKQFGVDLKQIVRLLSSRLYSTPDIVIRELVQNSYDAISARYKSDDRSGKIIISADSSRHTLTFADNGTGMNENDLNEYLSTLGKGVKQLENASGHNKRAPIGEYGIGFFSAFFIADQIQVRTRKVEDAHGYRWISSGVEGYDVEVDPTPLSDPGTEIILSVGYSAIRYSNPETIRRLVNKYCQFLDCPIYVNGLDEPVNKQLFAWELPKPADKLNWIRQHLTTDASYHKVGSEKVGRASFHFAFACGQAPETSRQALYSKRMYVTENLRFVPEYLQFMNALVNCDSLQLNLAREDVQQDATFHRLTARVEELLLEWLAELARRHRNEPAFLGIISQNQDVFKRLAATDNGFFDKVIHIFCLRRTTAN